MARKKSKASTATSWADGAVEVPREDVDANRKRVNRQRFYRRFIIAAIILLPISALTNIVQFGSARSTDSSATQTTELASAGKAAAIEAVNSWLAETIKPLPGGGTLLSWDGVDNVDKPTQTDAEKTKAPLPAFSLEIHHFSVIDGLGTYYTVDVEVAVDPTSGAHVLGTPSAVPEAPATQGGTTAGASPWFGLQSATAPDPVSGAVKAWATAFTSGDPDALRLAVQDSNGQHAYVPLTGVTSVSTTITAAAYIPDASAPNATTSKNMLVQVQMQVQWNGTAAAQPSDNAPVITYDLLVTNADGGAPVIVAWGGPGTGTSLTPYQNALTDRSVNLGGN